MSKETQNKKNIRKNDAYKPSDKEKRLLPGYFFHMSMTPSIEENANWFQLLPISFFSALIILFVRMATYTRPMDQFFWSGDVSQRSDFFSYYKMIAIIACAVLILLILSYRLFIQSFSVRRSSVYFPMIAYSLFVILSYLQSDYKDFSLLGWNDRFEGTLVLLSYMLVLFYIINTLHTERDIKYIIYPVAASSFLLGLLGLTQAFGHDFFRTNLGKKMITPSWFWDQLDSLNFTFQNNQIYQTVFNINYVSFYLTLLIPLVGMLFINSFNKKETLWKSAIWLVLFALLLFNLIGSASSGGIMGMAIVVVVGVVVLNKRIIHWIKPVILLIIISLVIAGSTYSRWIPELTGAINASLGTQTRQIATEQNNADTSANTEKHKIDYMITSGQAIILSMEGNQITFHTFAEDPTVIRAEDIDGEKLNVKPTTVSPIYQVDDDRFKTITVRSAQDEQKNHYIVLGTDGKEWPFLISETGPKYLTGLGKTMDLRRIPAIGWENNPGFGSGRGYIWSRTIPLMKDTLLLGHGADTYCIYYPQDDYVGKYNSANYYNNLDIVIDKPHNMYFGAFIGTGGLSVLSLLVLWGLYIVQSFKIYIKKDYDGFLEFAGAGIFFGICGFLVSGIVNDSSVSVMPLFYGLLGTGISINLMLKTIQKNISNA